MSINHLTNLQQRLIAGIFGGGIIIAATVWSVWSFFAVFLLIGFLCQVEFYKLISTKDIQPNIYIGVFTGMFNYCLLFVNLQLNNFENAHLFILNFPLFTLIFFFELYRQEKRPFVNIAITIIGIIYTSFPFSLFIFAVFSSGYYSWQIALGCLMLLWASDTGAYFAGRMLGKRKLFERISPKKTWEGSLGGLVLSVAIALVLGTYFPDLEPWKWIILSVIIVVAGSYGDLVESLLKRSLDVKDSGSIIPGHGGFLDRFDGLILALPFIATFLVLFR